MIFHYVNLFSVAKNRNRKTFSTNDYSNNYQNINKLFLLEGNVCNLVAIHALILIRIFIDESFFITQHANIFFKEKHNINFNNAKNLLIIVTLIKHERERKVKIPKMTEQKQIECWKQNDEKWKHKENVI